MSALQSNQQTAQEPMPQAASGDGTVRDASGCPIFFAGDAGSAHVTAHRMTDAKRMAVGHHLLGQWLEGHSGSGSEWIHLQFHMALFELELGDWDAAYGRFRSQILPAAATSENALTDAPALLWRLALAAPEGVALPWQPLRNTALGCMKHPSDPFVQLHNLLALAGAGDLENLDRWLQSQPMDAASSQLSLLWRMAVALKAYVAKAYQQAANAFESVLPQLAVLGGSGAQSQLFKEMARSSWRLANDGSPAPWAPIAT